MTEQRALEIVKDLIPYMSGIDEEAMNIVERAVEKQIAKKPARLKKNICPNCSWGIIMRTQKYCDECGQKLER